MSDLGDRMKGNYERRARHYLSRRTPVIVRVDGRAFHTWCRGLDKPFDKNLIRVMARSAKDVADDMQGWKATYIQSDEANFLLTDYDELTTEAWFDYCQSKVESIAASLMTARFNHHWSSVDGRKKPALFDARAFNIPETEIANYFLWRAQDWERNSLSMYCRSQFSHKQMNGVNRQGQHDLLHSAGLNWTTDLTNQEKNGTWLFPADIGISECHVIPPSYVEIAERLDSVLGQQENRDD